MPKAAPCGHVSGRLRASLTRDGQSVALSLGSRIVALDEVLTVERETLSLFLAVAGEYEEPCGRRV